MFYYMILKYIVLFFDIISYHNMIIYSCRVADFCFTQWDVIYFVICWGDVEFLCDVKQMPRQ